MGALAAVALTVVSSGGSAVGKAMQKQGTRSLPRLRLERGVLRQYARCRPWVVGISLDVAGALLMVAAVAQAPVRLVSWRRRSSREREDRIFNSFVQLRASILFFFSFSSTTSTSTRRQGRLFFFLLPLLILKKTSK